MLTEIAASQKICDARNKDKKQQRDLVAEFSESIKNIVFNSTSSDLEGEVRMLKC